MGDPQRSLTAIQARADVGVGVLVDDFGTGYSSLAYLKRLPVAELKIDRTFVRDLATDPADAAIVQAIVTLGQRLGLTTVAEGVENAETLARLDALGTSVAQGFHFTEHSHPNSSPRGSPRSTPQSPHNTRRPAPCPRRHAPTASPDRRLSGREPTAASRPPAPRREVSVVPPDHNRCRERFE